MRTGFAQACSIACRRLTIFAIAASCFAVSHGAARQIDTEFGSGGFAFVGTENAWPSHAGTAIAVQNDGKILAGGFAGELIWPSGHVDGVIARLNPDGSLDTAFGNAGVFLTSLDSIFPLNYGERTSLRDIAVDPQGRILWAGGQCVSRVLPNGTLDTSFGIQDPAYPEYQGFFLTGQLFTRFNQLVLRPDGSILAVGIQNGHGLVVCLDPNGSPDASFGTETTPLNSFAPPGGYSRVAVYPASGYVEEPLDATLDANGNIIVAGLLRNPSGETFGTVTKFAADGSLDAGFGVNGQLLIDFSNPAFAESANSVAVTAEGKYVVAVNTSGAEPFDFVIRLNDDGTLDPMFGGGDGIAEIDTITGNGNVQQLVLQPNGRILVVGSAGSSAATWRLLSDGTPDADFSNNAFGRVTHPFQTVHVEAANDLAIQAGGRAVVIGNQYNLPNPELESLFGIVQLQIGSPPIAVAGDDVIRECTGDLTLVSLDGSASWDPDGDELTFEWSVPDGSGALLDDPTAVSPSGVFPMGPTLVTLTVDDGNGGIAVNDVLISVQDTTPPVLVCTTDQIALWPPNHEVHEVWICIAASEACTDPENLQLDLTIGSSEPDDGSGDGTSTGDVDGHDGFTAPVAVTDLVYDPLGECFYAVVSLRAERDGVAAGRVYSMVCNVTDESNNSATASCVVVVPKNRR